MGEDSNDRINSETRNNVEEEEKDSPELKLATDEKNPRDDSPEAEKTADSETTDPTDEDETEYSSEAELEGVEEYPTEDSVVETSELYPSELDDRILDLEVN